MSFTSQLPIHLLKEFAEMEMVRLRKHGRFFTDSTIE
jgi:hypothetical protein